MKLFLEALGAHSFIKDEDGKMWSVVEKPSGVEVEEEVGVGENSNGQLKIRNLQQEEYAYSQD